MKAPSSTLVVDAAVLISAIFGRSSAVILSVAESRILVTTERAVEEARRRVELGAKRPDLLPLLDLLLESVAVIALDPLEAWMAANAASLKYAPASRNGSIRDAHILTLAWDTDADIWTTDRDFAGTGVATWSTLNLLRALVEPA